MKNRALVWILGAALIASTGASAAEAKSKSKPKATPVPEAKAEEKAAPKEEPKATPSPEPTKAPEAKAEAKEEPKSEAKEAAGHRSPGLALVLAIVPGVAIHGSGHLYAGSYMKGVGLMVIDGVSAAYLIQQSSNNFNDFTSGFTSAKNGTVPENVGAAYSALGLCTVATAAFLYTWWEDMAGAGSAAENYNKKAEAEAAQARMMLAPRNEGAMLVYQRNF